MDEMDDFEKTISEIDADMVTDTLTGLLNLSKEDRSFALGFVYGLVAARHRSLLDKAEDERIALFTRLAREKFLNRKKDSKDDTHSTPAE